MTILNRIKTLFLPLPSAPPNTAPTSPNASSPIETLSLSESESEFLVGAVSLNTPDFDRDQYSREELQQQCLDAWRLNPLARRITEITSQYVVGGGFTISSPDKVTNAFLKDFWSHRFNHLDTRLIEICDELTRSGNLFILLSTDSGGMTYLRPIPASLIHEIQTKESDIEQEESYTLKGSSDLDPLVYPAYRPETECFDNLPHAVVHYAINKPAGAVWGESDLAPILKWLSRYSAFLDDRVRLNRYRNAFLYIVKSLYANETTRRARQTQLAANPPTPGSILVTDQSEEWEVLSPKLESDDAERDGLALKKMIASGAGLPLHFLAEPESSTRSTAEASGGPTYRKFQQRQQFLTWLIKDLLMIALTRHSLVTGTKLSDEIEVHPSDLSGRDNVALAMAGSNIASSFETLYNLGAVSQEEFIRVLYRFIGEECDPQQIVSAGTGVDIRKITIPSSSTARDRKQPLKIDPTTGDPKEPNP